MVVVHLRQFKKGVTHISKLAEVRRQKGYSQEALSAMSGVHRMTIARFESGKAIPKLSTLKKLSETLGVPIDELIDREAG